MDALSNIAALYGYCLRMVDNIWRGLDEQYSPRDVQSGAATVFRHAVRYVPAAYLTGDKAAADNSARGKVDAVIELYRQALHLSLERWRKLGRYDMESVQAGAATIMIQYLQLNSLDEDEVVVQPDTRSEAGARA